MKCAHPINALVPVSVWQESYGIRRKCLDFYYDGDYHQWPKAVEYEGRVYVLTGYNSDTNRIHYKEGKVAYPK
jgi:hypothetical protein